VDIYGEGCSPPATCGTFCRKAERFRSIKTVTLLPESHIVTELTEFMLAYLSLSQEIGDEDLGRYEGTEISYYCDKAWFVYSGAEKYVMQG
jgi:hypothetical protein